MASPLQQDKVLVAPYGSWKSPITADIVAAGSKQLGGTTIDGQGRLFWVESRPNDNGRLVLVKEATNPGEEPTDITPSNFSVRTLAQGYGGGAFTMSGDTVIFANYDDQRLYKQSLNSLDSSPVPLTPDYGSPSVSFADGVFHSGLNRFITVMEDRSKSSIEAITTIAAVSLGGGDIQEPKVLLTGNNFYAFPRIDPKGEKIAWIEWAHPNMPWDITQLWVGYFSENGDVVNRTCVTGGDSAIIESPTEPKWSPSGELFFISDRRNGFWNLYKWNESINDVEALYTLDAEFSRPLWTFGTKSYEFIQNNAGKNLIACCYRQKGRSYFCILDYAASKSSSLSVLDIAFTDIENITSGINCLYIEGASATLPSSIAKVVLDATASKVTEFQVVWSSSADSSKFTSYYSSPELIEFPTEVAGQFTYAYAFFYPPTNPDYQPSQVEKPPLLLKSHGGPTNETRGILDLNIQYYTSRGWSVVDVNYSGSTGFGREYRERLYKYWGIVDVNDCCNCAKFLVDSGKADGKRLCITGGSAGGFTTLACLAFRQTFDAGASLYGVADLDLLRKETHKFESYYPYKLVGTDEEAFYERSPINSVDKISCPIVLFQGLEDTIVPPDQARKIYNAVLEKGLPVALKVFPGEQHGFRKAENIIYTLEQQMVFFARLVGKFTVADNIVPMHIDNYDPPESVWH